MHQVIPEIGHYCRPMPGETACGDIARVWKPANRMVMALADGLGHGPEACAAADAAMMAVEMFLDLSCEDVFEQCNKRLYDTRGVALAVAVIENLNHPTLATMTIATVGNIRAVVYSGRKERRLGGAPGIVGAGYRDLCPETVSLHSDDVLLLYSDGLEELLPWSEILTSGLSVSDMAMAGVTRWGRENDDAGLLIYRHGQADASIRTDPT